jgi:hypothetical protein
LKSFDSFIQRQRQAALLRPQSLLLSQSGDCREA